MLTIQPLIFALKDTNDRIRLGPINALGRVSSPNDDVILALKEAAIENNKEISELARKILNKIQNQNKIN